MSVLRDRLISRCGWCGNHCYGSRPCDACGTRSALAEVRSVERQAAVTAQRRRELVA